MASGDKNGDRVDELPGKEREIEDTFKLAMRGADDALEVSVLDGDGSEDFGQLERLVEAREKLDAPESDVSPDHRSYTDVERQKAQDAVNAMSQEERLDLFKERAEVEKEQARELQLTDAEYNERLSTSRTEVGSDIQDSINDFRSDNINPNVWRMRLEGGKQALSEFMEGEGGKTMREIGLSLSGLANRDQVGQHAYELSRQEEDARRREERDQLGDRLREKDREEQEARRWQEVWNRRVEDERKREEERRRE